MTIIDLVKSSARGATNPWQQSLSWETLLFIVTVILVTIVTAILMTMIIVIIIAIIIMMTIITCQGECGKLSCDNPTSGPVVGRQLEAVPRAGLQVAGNH